LCVPLISTSKCQTREMESITNTRKVVQEGRSGRGSYCTTRCSGKGLRCIECGELVDEVYQPYYYNLPLWVEGNWSPCDYKVCKVCL